MAALTRIEDDPAHATIEYYDRHAEPYAKSTLAVDMSAIYDRFLQFVVDGGRILDAGSGSGRDTRAFLSRGYTVDAFDASPQLAALSSRLTGIETRVVRFQDFTSSFRYDGIWACASLLHVPREALKDALRRLLDVLNSGGALYVSFKRGSAERVAEDGRFFLDVDEPVLRRLFSEFPELQVAELWTSQGEGARQGKDEWLNAIAVKRPRSDVP